jgi:glycerol-3-phosphate dehydrogenase (NAD(P)+)
MNKIGIIGGGKWGEAIQFAFMKNGLQPKIWSRSVKNLPNFSSLDEVLNSEYLVVVIAAQTIRNWLKEYFQDKGQKILVASKGIDIKTGKFMSEIFEDFIESKRVAYLSGPSFAHEVKQSLPTALVISSQNKTVANQFGSFFPDFIKIYTSQDIIGSEVAGAYKNILAIASGICEGLKLGQNAKAALIARGLVEMERFGTFYGGKTETFLSLSGAGDLFLTANSPLSRNYRVGLMLAEGKNIDDILNSLGEVAEGVQTVKAIMEIKKDLYTPIADEVYKIIYERKKVQDALKTLLS